MLNPVKIKESIHRISAITWSNLVQRLNLFNSTMVKADLLTSVMQALIAITTYDLVRLSLKLFCLFMSYKVKMVIRQHFLNVKV